MTIQQTGVQFVNSGLGTALAGMTQYNTALGVSTNAVLNFTNTFNNKMAGTSKGVVQFNAGIGKLLLTMSGFYVMKRIVNELLDSLGSLWDSMIQGAASAELLNIRFQNLVATSIQSTQGIEDYSQALEMAQGPAADLMEWVNQMAVKTLFSRDQIAEVMALSMAFDLTAPQAQTLTKAIVDWASGMGLTDDALQRMIVNFGQMMRMGKITQRELRDLAVGGLFPVNEALKLVGEKAGLTGEALKAFMSDVATSGMPVNELLTAFVEITEQRFPNAAERMARTWKGVTQNIQDFVTTILGASLLGPTMAKMVDRLTGALDNALSPAVRGAANEIGERLATNLGKLFTAFGKVISVIGNVAKAFGIVIPPLQDVIAYIEIFVDIISTGMTDAAQYVQDWLDTTASTFAKGASDFLDWGFEMVAQFAIGIIEGASTVLAAAMNVIASVLSFFLAPGSPPRVAPNIDKWGKAAMEQYLHGFTQADFDILNDLEGPIKAALDSLAKIGAISQDSVGKMFASVSKQIMLAIHQLETTGKVGEAVFRAIRAAGGMYGKELEALARKQFALLAATKELEKAQQALTKARTADNEAKKRVDDLVKEYQELVEAGASSDILEAKRAEIKAAMEAREGTREEITLQEQRVKTAEEAIKPLEDAVKLQEELVAQMIELANAQAEASKAAGGGAGAGAGALGSLGAALADFQSNMDSMRVKIALAQVEFENKIDATTRRVKAKLAGIFDPIKESWDRNVGPSIDLITTAFDRISTAVGRIKTSIPKTGIIAGIFGNLGKVTGFYMVFRGIVSVLGIFWSIIRVVIAPLLSILGVVSKLLPILIKIGPGFSVLGLALGGLALAWSTNFLGMSDAISQWYEDNEESINNVIALFQEGKILEALGSLGNLIVQWFGEINWKKIADTVWGGIKSGFNTIFNVAVDLGTMITNWFNSIDWKATGENVKTAVGNGIYDIFKEAVKLGTIIVGWFNSVDWKGTGESVKSSVEGGVKTVFENAVKLKDIIVGWFNSVDWEGVKTDVLTNVEAGGKVIFENAVKLGEIIIGWFNSIDWNAIDTAVSKNFDAGATTLMAGAVKLTDPMIEWLNNIDWGAVETAAGKVLSDGILSLMDFNLDLTKIITDWINGIDWTQVGGVFGVGLASAITGGVGAGEAGEGVLSSIDWDKLGAQFAENFKGGIEMAGAIFSAIGQIIVGFVAGFFMTYDFKEMAVIFIGNLGKAMSTLGYLIVSGITILIDGLIGMMKQVGSDIYNAIFSIGTTVVEAIVAGINSGASAIWSAILGILGLQGIDLGGIIPGLAQGGLVPSEGIYRLGEQGAEYVVPAGITQPFIRAMQMISRSQAPGRVSVAAPYYSQGNSNTSNKYFNLNVETVKSSGNVVTDFSIMEALAS